MVANVLQWVWCFTNITEWSDKIKQYLGPCNGYSTKGFGAASRRLRWTLTGDLHQRVLRVCYKGGNSNTAAWGRTIVSTPGIIYIKKNKMGQQTLLPLKIKHIFYDFHKTFPHSFCLEVINGYSIAIIKTPFKGNAVIQNLISHANRFTQKLNSTE